jgi:hypothetical protein
MALPQPPFLAKSSNGTSSSLMSKFVQASSVGWSGSGKSNSKKSETIRTALRAAFADRLQEGSTEPSKSRRQSSQTREPPIQQTIAQSDSPRTSNDHTASVAIAVQRDLVKRPDGNVPIPTMAPAPKGHARKPSSGGYKLQAVAYNPNPADDDDEDDEEDDVKEEKKEENDQSWKAGDDDTVKDLEAHKNVKIPLIPRKEVRKSSIAPHAPQLKFAPQLPPLSFDFDEQPYFQSQPQVEQKDFAYKQPTEQGTSKTSVISSQDTLRSGDDKGSTRSVTPKVPTQTSETQPEDSQKTPKPKIEIETIVTPKRQMPSDKPGETSSFYWHSPHSSSDTTSDRSPGSEQAIEDAEAQPQPKHRAKKSDDLTVNTKAKTAQETLVSATALGFGGPSDWEYFGGYDGDEVDDLALYSKPGALEEPSITREGASSLKNEDSSLDPDSGLLARDRKMLSTIQERASEFSNVDILEQAKAEAAKQESNGAEDVRDSVTSDTSIPPVPPLFSNPERNGSIPSAQLRRVESSSNLRETSTETHHSPQIIPDPTTLTKSTETFLNKSDFTIPSNKDASVPGSPAIQANVARKDSPLGVSNHGVVQAVPIENSKAHKLEPVSETIRDTSVHTDGTEEEQSPAGIGTGFMSPYSDDDGKEDIIISLQIPDELKANTDSFQPLPERTTRRGSAVPLKLEQTLHPRTMDSPEGLRSGRRSVFPQSIELSDPYANLDPWAKASLNRYVKMLHEEAQTSGENEKYAIFMNFVQKETRVRVVLYDIEDDVESEIDPQDSGVQRSSNGMDMGSSSRQPTGIKALPALPGGQDSAGPQTAEAVSFMNASGTGGAKLVTPDSAGLSDRLRSITEGPKMNDASNVKGSSDESFVMVDTPTTGTPPLTQRPLIAPHKAKEGSMGSLSSLRKALDTVATRAGAGPSNLSNNVSHDEAERDATPTRGTFDADPVRSNSVPLPSDDIHSQDGSEGIDKPPYTPMKFTEGKPYEGKPYEGDKAENRRSIYRPFSMLLRQPSQRATGIPEDSAPPVPPVKNMGPNGKPLPESLGAGVRPIPEAEPRPPNYRYTVLEPLLSVVPRSSNLKPEPEQIVRLRQEMEAIPDDFSFIHATVLAWDAEAKQNRERFDRERHARQGESEARIDALFNENEIGYGDIGELEAEFKRSEAARKSEEDRNEVQSFVAKVFDVVWARIHYEMDRLTPLYDICTDIVNQASAGKDMFDGPDDDRVPIASAMGALLTLYQKLMVRNQKAFEAVLERDRRLKKTEVAPYYALGDIEKVKRIEKRFEDAEKNAIVEFCGQRDERANLLMDVLDQNTLRGVGANQDYMESIMQAVRKVAFDVSKGEVDQESMVSSEEVVKARDITAALARSSEQIVQTFHVADMLLNAADYEVSVAKAKLDNADAASFKRLREAKAKEDLKLAADLEHRMSLIRGDTSRTQEEITRLLSLIRAEATEAPRSTSAPVDPDKQSRLFVAIDEAKKRTAQKDGG